MLEITPLDPRFPIQKQLELEAGPIVLVNIFTLDEGDEDDFLRIWREDALTIKEQRGFIRSQLYRAIGPQPTYVNHAVWRSVADYRAVLKFFAERFARYPPSTTSTPHLFQECHVEGFD